MEKNPIQQEFELNSELQQQKIQGDQTLNAPAMIQQQQQTQAALVEQTNPSHILDDVDLKLRGYRQIWDGSYEKVGEPLMNDKGRARIIFVLSGVVNQNTILSHLEKDEIGRIIVRISDDIVDDLVLNWKEYGICDKMLLDQIVDVVIIPAFMSLKRGYKQNEKNWLGRATIETINTSSKIQPNKKDNLFSRFKL